MSLTVKSGAWLRHVSAKLSRSVSKLIMLRYLFLVRSAAAAAPCCRGLAQRGLAGYRLLWRKHRAAVGHG